VFNRKALGPPSSRVDRVLATGLVVSALTPGAALAAPLANAAHGGPSYSPGYPSQIAPAQHDRRSPDAITGAPWVTSAELKRLRTSALAGTTSGSDAVDDGGLSTGAVLALIGGGVGLIALGGAGAITRYLVRLARDRLAA
jgi:hypothetical protein